MAAEYIDILVNDPPQGRIFRCETCGEAGCRLLWGLRGGQRRRLWTWRLSILTSLSMTRLRDASSGVKCVGSRLRWGGCGHEKVRTAMLRSSHSDGCRAGTGLRCRCGSSSPLRWLSFSRNSLFSFPPALPCEQAQDITAAPGVPCCHPKTEPCCSPPPRCPQEEALGVAAAT